MDNKYCSKCKETKRLDEFHRHSKKGTQGYCKRCRSHNPSRHDVLALGSDNLSRGMKYCGVCEEWREHALFLPSQTARDGYHATCRICRKKLMQDWRSSNQEHIQSYTAAYRQTEEHKVRQARCRHKRKTGNLKNNLTALEWKIVLLAQNNTCLACGRKFADGLFPTKDHIIPASRGGGLTMTNCQALCLSCNSRKNKNDTDYRPHDWDDTIMSIYFSDHCPS